MSKEKREQQKKARIKAERRAKNRKFLTIAIAILAVVLIVGGIGGYYYYNNVYLTKAIDDYSAGLSDDGLIAGIKATDYVELCDYKNIRIKKSELEMTEADWEEYINPILSQYGELSTETGIVVNEGDRVNIDYVGSIDGVEFEGGNTKGNGAQLVLGSGQYIEGFEEQIVGHATGESFDINVTFPEEYGKEELNGKDAVFAITINGKYVPAEYNDEFVSEYLAEDYETLSAEEYKNKHMAETYAQNYRTFIENSFIDNSTVKSYPEKYLNTVKGILKGYDIANFNATNDYYTQMVGSPAFEKFEDYTGMGVKEYEASLSTQGMDLVKKQLIIQAIYEDAGLTATSENLDEALSDFGVERQYYSNFELRYGKGYMQQLAISHAVYDYIESCITIE